MIDSKIKLKRIIAYMNKHFGQDSEEYSIFWGGKPQVIRYDPTTAISIWSCGAIVCMSRMVYFIQEDDGNWFSEEGGQSSFSLGWGESFVKAFNDLNEYVKENGVPYYYQLGTDNDGNTIYSENICGYELK